MAREQGERTGVMDDCWPLPWAWRTVGSAADGGRWSLMVDVDAAGCRRLSPWKKVDEMGFRRGQRNGFRLDWGLPFVAGLDEKKWEKEMVRLLDSVGWHGLDRDGSSAAAAVRHGEMGAARPSGRGVMGLSPAVIGSAAMAAERKWRRWVFDFYTFDALIDEEDRGIGFSTSSSTFWMAWIGHLHLSPELAAGSHGCRPWWRRRWSTETGAPATTTHGRTVAWLDTVNVNLKENYNRPAHYMISRPLHNRLLLGSGKVEDGVVLKILHVHNTSVIHRLHQQLQSLQMVMFHTEVESCLPSICQHPSRCWFGSNQLSQSLYSATHDNYMERNPPILVPGQSPPSAALSLSQGGLMKLPSAEERILGSGMSQQALACDEGSLWQTLCDPGQLMRAVLQLLQANRLIMHYKVGRGKME
ncbi:hypothetical protein ACLOJK_041273 [Asimina triloba]